MWKQSRAHYGWEKSIGGGRGCHPEFATWKNLRFRALEAVNLGFGSKVAGTLRVPQR